MDPDKLFRWQSLLDAMKAAFNHYPTVISMNSDIFVQTFNKMDFLQVDLDDLLVLLHINERLLIDSVSSFDLNRICRTGLKKLVD
jgi:hypothetical protein